LIPQCGGGRIDTTAKETLRQHHTFLVDEHGVSSAGLYKEYKGAYLDDYNISVPAAVSVFPEEVYHAPRSWSERAYHNLVHFNAVAKGGYFAAWEQPQLFSEEVRPGFRSLRG
jgi:hypothetical protein